MEFIGAILMLAGILYIWAAIVYIALWEWMRFCLWMLPSRHPKLFPPKENDDV